MSNLKVGDKVEVRLWDDMKKEFGLNSWGGIKIRFGFTPEMEKFCGKIVTIKKVFSNEKYEIEEDHGRFSWNDDMFVFKREMIVIYADVESRKVAAVDKSTGEKAEAYCHPDDRFDFKKGAFYAFDRLRGREERVNAPHKGYNGEVIFIKENPMLNAFTVGKIYKVKNGVIKNDDGGLMNFKKKFFNEGFAEVKR